MNIKLLALDMDGTTLKSDHVTLSSANRLAIEAAIAQGIQVVVATGRMRNRIPEPVEEIPGIRYAITSNGAAVNDLMTGEILYSKPLSKQTTLQIFDILEGIDVYFEVYCNGNDYADKRQLSLFDAFEFPNVRREMMVRNRFPVDDLRTFVEQTDMPIEKINFPHIPDKIAADIQYRLSQVTDVVITSSVPQNAEVNAALTNKADGLAHLCKHLGIAREDVMAIGDNGNDLELLEFAGFSAAPANATEKAKQLASYVGPSNDEDIVAHVIEKFLL